MEIFKLATTSVSTILVVIGIWVYTLAHNNSNSASWLERPTYWRHDAILQNQENIYIPVFYSFITTNYDEILIPESWPVCHVVDETLQIKVKRKLLK